MSEIQEQMMTRQHVVPDDFPRERWPALVPGSQPKLLVSEKDGRYYTDLAGDELWTRYDACEDLARQLSVYASRKMSGFSLSLDDALDRAEKGVKAKVSAGLWDFSPAEIAWVMKRTRELLSVAASGAGRSGCL
ncbi:hypothetical protein [Paraburkholderia sp. BR14374]|uniref:hypothetical protein n=1 Tax=Paraburkholderia sp. BR14374 TaxID=3237007 RepID=UPI0034CE4283